MSTPANASLIKDKAMEIWNFFRAAGILQAVVDAKSIKNLKELPYENWAVLSCPTKGLNFDEKTLKFMDANGDGHLRVSEVLAALEWMDCRIADMSSMLADTDVAKLSNFSDTDDGRKLLETAKALLKAIGKPDATEITLADVSARQASFLASDFNGDGVLVPKAIKSEKGAKLCADIIATTGGTDDRSGAKGVDKAVLESFLQACQDHLAWIERGRAEAATLLPLGDGTAAAVAATEAVRTKVEDYFHRCRLAAFDEAAVKPLNRGEADYAAVSQDDMAKGADVIATFPLSRIEANAPLRLRDGVNPEWSAKIADFADKAVKPLLGDVESITEADWRKICAALAPNIAWTGAVGGACVASLGEARIKEALGDTASKDEILKLIAKDLEGAAEINNLDNLERFVRYHAGLNRFLNNYVNFSDYYNPDRSEIYRAGKLYIDGRVCNECVYVADAGAHSALAATSKIFLAYCDVVRPQTGEKRTICAAVTAGFASSLWVGRNGVFYDAAGLDWNAVITKICECQISLKEAFWSPWLKICDLISDQIKKLLSSKETAMMGSASAKVSTIGEAPATPPPEQKRDGAAMASSVAAIGIALGIIGTAIGGLLSALKGVHWWQGVLGVAAIILIVSGPAVLLAWFKLRSRDFAPVLKACGWAINKKMLMPMRLGRIFTHEAVVPDGSKINMSDPYVEKHTLRNVLLVVLVVVAFGAWVWKWHNNWLPKSWQREQTSSECVEGVAEEAATGAAPAEAPAAEEVPAPAAD